MKNEINIGIMGGLINNRNLGCLALTYSLLKELETLSKDRAVNFNYIIFDYVTEEAGAEQISRELSIDRSRIKVEPIGKFYFYTPKKVMASLKSWRINVEMIKSIKKCDLVIDISQGDSFTDIYGEYRFYTLTSIKWLVEKLRIPFILGPQTYGPFRNSKSKKFARQVIENAEIVASRDLMSKMYVEQFTNKKVINVTDLAFALPYHLEKNKNQTCAKIKVGINPSGLLSKSKTEGTIVKNEVTVNYDKLMRRVVEYLKSEKKYEIHLIPHVGDEAYKCMPNMTDVIYHREFKNPVEAKSVIAQMDIFIGARMHATIAAFSAGVATIPIAYSRKFEGLFKSIGYNCVIDITKLDDEQAYTEIIENVLNYSNLKNQIQDCKKNVEKKRIEFRDLLDNEIMKIVQNKQQ